MSAESFLVVGKSDVGVDAAVEDGSVDVYDVHTVFFVFEEIVAGRKGAVGYDVIVRGDGGAEAGEDNCV